MKAIFAVMNTTKAVVKRRPEKNSGLYGIWTSAIPVQAWIFFQAFFSLYCLSSVHNCEDRFHIHVFIRSSNVWLSYIHS